MTMNKAITTALKYLQRELRHKRIFYDMYLQGFLCEKPGHDAYLEIKEAMEILEAMKS